MSARSRARMVTAALLGCAALQGCGNDDRVPAAGALDATTVEDAAVASTDSGSEASTRDGGGDAGSGVGIRDRAGRPFFARLLVSPANWDLVNTTGDPFRMTYFSKAPKAQRSVGEDVEGALTGLDGLDGKVDFPPLDAGGAPHADLVLADALLIDPSKPATEDGFLDIEVNQGAHSTAGGRHPACDAFDVTLSWLVGGTRVGVSDGVALPRPVSKNFPYLAPPE